MLTCKMIKSVKNAEHYNWGNKCSAWHLLKSESLSVIQESMSPGTEEQLHYHAKAQQVFFVLKGTASFEINGVNYLVQPHESIHVPPGIKHKIANNSFEDLEFLVISEPPSHTDRINC